MDELDLETCLFVRLSYEDAIHATFWFSAVLAACALTSSRKRHLDPDDKGLRSAYDLTIVEHIEYTSNRNPIFPKT